MASGDTLLILTPLHNSPPATLYATEDWVAGASTPAENIPVLDFDDTAIEYADFYCVMPRLYGGGGLTITFGWSASVTGTNAVLSAAFRAIPDDAEDLDTTAFTYDYNNTGALAAASVAGEVVYDTLTFTNGADMDSVAVGEAFILRVRRVPTDANDNLGADLQLHTIEIKET